MPLMTTMREDTGIGLGMVRLDAVWKLFRCVGWGGSEKLIPTSIRTC